MGARRELVKGIVFGLVAGVAITVAFFQLRGRATISAAPKPLECPPTPLPPPPVTRSPSPLPSPPELGGDPYKFDPDHGASTTDEWWAQMPPNPAWDDARETKVLDRIARLGVKLDANQVECKRRCCRITLPDDVYDEHLADIRSSVGLDFEPPDGLSTAKAGSVYVVTKCWMMDSLDKPFPDRALERDALLAKAKPDLDRCASTTSPAITLKLVLYVDPEGQITKVDSNAKQLGQKAASCAETAVLQAASFAPSPLYGEVPLTIVLGK